MRARGPLDDLEALIPSYVRAATIGRSVNVAGVPWSPRGGRVSASPALVDPVLRRAPVVPVSTADARWQGGVVFSLDRVLIRLAANRRRTPAQKGARSPKAWVVKSAATAPRAVPMSVVTWCGGAHEHSTVHAALLVV